MTSSSHALRRFVAALILTSLAAPFPATAAAPRKAKARSAVSRPAVPSSSIIPLPLNPIVPAGQRLCAARTASGLGYSMLRPSSGTKPAGTDIALVNYIGYLAASGAVFDQGMGSPLPVDGVIPGFAEGLQMLAKNGVARFCVPAALGYGAKGTGPVPANADLVFQVELVDYKTAAEVESLRKADGAQPAPQ